MAQQLFHQAFIEGLCKPGLVLGREDGEIKRTQAKVMGS